MRVDSLQKEEEIRSVFWVFFEVLIDHVQRALKYGIKYLGNVLGNMTLQKAKHSFSK